MQSTQLEYDKSVYHNSKPHTRSKYTTHDTDRLCELRQSTIIKCINSFHGDKLMQPGKSVMVAVHHQVTPARKTSNQVAHQMYTRNYTIGPVLLAAVTQGGKPGQLLWDGQAHNRASVTSDSNTRRRVGVSSHWDDKVHHRASVTSGSNTKRRVGAASLWDGKAMLAATMLKMMLRTWEL